jgi:hypothetical protein
VYPDIAVGEGIPNAFWLTEYLFTRPRRRILHRCIDTNLESPLVLNSACFRRALLRSVCLGLLTVVTGCGDGGPAMSPVSGKVTIGGQPAPDVLVTFTPSDSSLETASGRTGADGSYTLTSGVQGKLGAMTGSYTVTLAQQAASIVDPTQAGYGDAGNSGPPPALDSNIPDGWSKPVDVAAGENTIDLAVE